MKSRSNFVVFALLAGIVALLVIPVSPPAQAASTSPPAQVVQVDEVPSAQEESPLLDIFLSWGSLAGFAAVVALVVNIGKSVGIVQDGQAQNWVAGLNLVVLAGLLITKVFQPDADIGAIDAQAAEFARVGLVVFSYVIQLLSSRGTYLMVKNIPLIGTSNSERNAPAG